MAVNQLTSETRLWLQMVAAYDSYDAYDVLSHKSDISNNENKNDCENTNSLDFVTP